MRNVKLFFSAPNIIGLLIFFQIGMFLNAWFGMRISALFISVGFSFLILNMIFFPTERSVRYKMIFYGFNFFKKDERALMPGYIYWAFSQPVLFFALYFYAILLKTVFPLSFEYKKYKTELFTVTLPEFGLNTITKFKVDKERLGLKSFWIWFWLITATNLVLVEWGSVHKALVWVLGLFVGALALNFLLWVYVEGDEYKKPR